MDNGLCIQVLLRMRGLTESARGERDVSPECYAGRAGDLYPCRLCRQEAPLGMLSHGRLEAIGFMAGPWGLRNDLPLRAGELECYCVCHLTLMTRRRHSQGQLITEPAAHPLISNRTSTLVVLPVITRFTPRSSCLPSSLKTSC
ncbi:unnamed protein product [Pleuronectes platessa]|uniref:Uncharacterized protein n=1 Tax=Pleuronectes platessa TaxID=8262 RepID=A0A9N7VXP6_PLEPL|nr:unnamed protein product [Pleuronectes platessa]